VNPNNVTYVLSTMARFSETDQKKMQDDTNRYFEKIKQKEQIVVKYVFFETEVEMMTMFFHKILPKIPFLTGWNVIAFDWLYLVNRAKNLNIDPMKNMLGKLIGNAKMPSHMGLVDYMEVFKTIKPFKVIENYKLDYVSNLVLGVSKLKTNYSSMMEAQKDHFNFVLYNIIDTVLVKFMEDKLKLLSVVFSISKVARIEVSKVFSNVFIAETLLCREFLKRGKHLSNDKRQLPEQTTYDGAFVMPPIPGYYKYIACYDFASMYPNIQIQFNISPDSYLGKGPAEGPHEIYTKNNTRFTNKFDSASRTILIGLYDERKRLKKVIKHMKEALKERQRVAA
jgi:DNA polymerase elongation subunit (family B)